MILTLRCMAQHWLHIQSVHSMHFFRAGRALSHVSHSWSGSSVLLWKNSCSVTRKTLLFMARTPRGGTTHWVLHSGQRNAWPGPICDWARLDSRHSKQKLCRHGNSLGALNSWLHTGQSSRLSIADDESPASAGELVSRWRWLVVVLVVAILLSQPGISAAGWLARRRTCYAYCRTLRPQRSHFDVTHLSATCSGFCTPWWVAIAYCHHKFTLSITHFKYMSK